MKLISIILPTHNGERYLAQSVESCLRQTHSNFELIIVNDCSKDSTPQIADAFAAADPRVKVIHLNPNRKLPGALNAGFAAAKGDYLTWTSDDNYYAPTAIAVMAQYLDEHPDVGLVYANYMNVDDNGKQLNPGDTGPPEMLAYFGVVGACFMYPKRIKDVIGEYDETLFCAEDYDYWLRIATRFSLAWIKETLYFYRRHERSLTSTQRNRMLCAMDGALTKSLPNLTKISRPYRAKGYMTLSGLRRQRRKFPSSFFYLLRASVISFPTVFRHLANGFRNRIRGPHPAPQNSAAS